MDANGANLRRLTNNPADDHWPAWSPNGKSIAFSSNRDGNYEIYVVDANGANPRRLTTYPGQDDYPAWSPDSQSIVFASFAREPATWAIHVMAANGTNLHLLNYSAYLDREPAWSPDGRYIAFRSDRDGTPQIFVMDAGGTNLRRLTSSNTEVKGSPAWSPDSKYIAFFFDRPNYEIYVVAPDGTNPRNLTNHLSADWDPAWGP